MIVLQSARNIWRYVNTNDMETSWCTRVPEVVVWANLVLK